MDKIASRTTYLELLLENPQAIEQLIELCAQSQMIAEQVARYPILLDELLNTERYVIHCLSRSTLMNKAIYAAITGKTMRTIY